MAEIDTEIQGYVNGVFWERNTLTEQNATPGDSKRAKQKRGRRRQSKESTSKTEQDAVQKTLFD